MALRDESISTFFTDGSRLDSKVVGAAVVWNESGKTEWRPKGTHLGTNKEVFDAELFALGTAAEIITRSRTIKSKARVFSDSTTTLNRIRHNGIGPGQALAQRAIRWTKAAK